MPASSPGVPLPPRSRRRRRALDARAELADRRGLGLRLHRRRGNSRLRRGHHPRSAPTNARALRVRNVWRARHMPFRARCSNASRRPADAAAATGPVTGHLLAEFQDRQRLCEPAVRARRPREAREQLTRLARADDLGRTNSEGAPRTDDSAASAAQVPKPVRLLAVEKSDDQRLVPLECEERRPVLAARASTPVEDDRPRRHEPRVQALDAVRDPLVEARHASGEPYLRPALCSGSRSSRVIVVRPENTSDGRQRPGNRCDWSSSGFKEHSRTPA